MKRSITNVFETSEVATIDICMVKISFIHLKSWKVCESGFRQTDTHTWNLKSSVELRNVNGNPRKQTLKAEQHINKFSGMKTKS